MHAIYVSHMGSDNTVCDAARVSMNKRADQYTDEQNHKLIKYLANHNHFTPFCHPQITLNMQAPVPIRTQCFKSKIGFVENETSRRYLADTPIIYIPEFRTKPEGSIKQGSGGIHPYAEQWAIQYSYHCKDAVRLYEKMIADGVAPEQARFILPQGAEVNWIWTGSLYAYARFFNLRSDSHAQSEIQTLANEVASIIQPLFPVSWEALTHVRT